MQFSTIGNPATLKSFSWKNPHKQMQQFPPPKNQQKRLSVESKRVEKEKECCTVLHTHRQRNAYHTTTENSAAMKNAHTHWRFGSLRDANQCKNKHHPRANTR
jgi:hypothetical protein